MAKPVGVEQPPELHAEPEHIAELGELDASERLGEDVSRVLIPRDMRHCNRLLLNLLADPMVGMVDVLHGALMLGVLQYLDGRLVVHEKRQQACRVIAELFEKVPHPHNFTADLRGGSVLQFSAQQ
jgi:hypothetical protein